MTIFDLLFIGVVLGSVVVIVCVGLFAIRGQRPQALNLLRWYAFGAAGYLAIVLIVSPLAPARELHLNEPLCFDDWCIAVIGVQWTASASEVTYLVQLRLSSQARRITQRENNLVVYLTDARGRRFEPISDPASVPFNTILHPMESVVTSRTFHIPGALQQPALAIAHEGGFPLEWLIIGEGPFHRVPSFRLDAPYVRAYPPPPMALRMASRS